MPLLLLAGVAHAKPVLVVPKHDKPMPMLVVLHGDREHATDAAARWRSAAKARGFVLLALEVPHGTSWWQWGGEPSEVLAMIDEQTRDVDIDRSRVYLAGWSGGASYIGLRMPAWARVFAGIVIHGGGQPPWDPVCSDAPQPIYFLVGDENPLHHLAKDLRTYADGCTHVTKWDVLRHAAHAGERRALTRKKGIAILDWLTAKR